MISAAVINSLLVVLELVAACVICLLTGKPIFTNTVVASQQSAN